MDYSASHPHVRTRETRRAQITAENALPGGTGETPPARFERYRASQRLHAVLQDRERALSARARVRLADSQVLPAASALALPGRSDGHSRARLPDS